MQQVLSTGAGVVLKINGNTVGFATGIGWQRSQSLKTIYEIDNVFAREIAPTVYSIAGNLTGLRLIGGGGLDGPEIMDLSSVAAFFYQKYVTIEIVDKKTNKVTNTFQNVLFESDSWQINAKQVTTFSASFKAVFMSNDVSDQA